MNGQGYPEHTDYGASYRLSLFLLPDYSFTPQLWNDMAETLLGSFLPQQTVVSKVDLRGDEDRLSVPARWLLHQEIDPEWLDSLREMFADQAERMQIAHSHTANPAKAEHLTFSFLNPNFMLLTYDATVREGLPTSEQTRVSPTQTEVWAKALYAALLIHFLTGVRVYLTDRSYLTITRPEQMRRMIEMDGLHPLLFSLLPLPSPSETRHNAAAVRSHTGTQLPLVALPATVDLLSAIWHSAVVLFPQATSEQGNRNQDKQVAFILEELARTPFAGATLYKRLERGGGAANAAFIQACSLLLPDGSDTNQRRKILADAGYIHLLTKEGHARMDVLQRLTDLSLHLYLPFRNATGRANRYERLFRAGIEALKSYPGISSVAHQRLEDKSEEDQILIAWIGGRLMKTLSALQNSRSGSFPVYGDARLPQVEQFARLLAVDLFRVCYKSNSTRLTQQVDALAATVYFLTSKEIDARWAMYSASKEQSSSTQQTQISVKKSATDQ
jgi:hypothetical protein